ncbi:MAG: CehA/McbA family metallohydrolase [Myxococcaceae bacterium]
MTSRASTLIVKTLLLAFGLATLGGCPKKDGGGGPPPVKRCELDLAATGLFAQEGTGAFARAVESGDDLIGGQTAVGRNGDVLLQNDKVRVVIEQPGRQVGPVLYGGSIIDADLVRPQGAPGRDQFGRMGLIYALGRVTKVTNVEILADGSAGGPAVVASTGDDVPHDLVNLKGLVTTQLDLNVSFVVDPSEPRPFRVTTYYVLSPGESRVRMLTAFCNDGEAGQTFPLAELLDFRGSVEVFNPGGCANGLGTAECLVDSSRWVGAQGDGVAYGIRSQALADLATPGSPNATIIYGGVVGTIVEAKDMAGLLSWTDAEARQRPGSFGIRGGGQRSYLRDFVVARDLAGVSAELLRIDASPSGRVEVTSKNPDGSPAPFARVAVVATPADRLEILVETDENARGVAVVPPGTYSLSAAREGSLPGVAVPVTVGAGAAVPVELSLSASRTLTVRLADPSGAPVPGKVEVRCPAGACPFSSATWKRHLLLEQPADGTAAVGWVPAAGRLDLALPPGEYEVVVSRGPEYSVWPDTWPVRGQSADLRTADGAVDAVVGRVLDTPGWMSADLHVHAVNSTDSLISNELRVATFLAEGVDVLVSTDHEFVTDYAPVIQALGAGGLMASMIGEEVTSFTHGHFNTFPVPLDPASPNGGAFDHAGGDGPSLRMTELFPGIKEAFPGAVVQINHPRGAGGALTQLRVDTATLASHGAPEDFLMAAAPDATASDTRLFGDGFDAIEVANGTHPSFTVMNDWMTFLSRGTVRTATGVSDSHKALSHSGYSRTWARLGVDRPADFTFAPFAEAIRNHQAIVSNGPFLKVAARKVDAAGVASGAAVDIGGTLSISPAASEGIELTVDVTAPDWVQFDRVELYSHAPGREAVNGESNSGWPEGRILAKKVLDPLSLPVEAVPGPGSLRRLHLVESFVQRPTADTWFVVMVRSVGPTRSLSPLIDSTPYAFSNAILVDADGTGAYDNFPLQPGQPLKFQPPARQLSAPRPLTEADLKLLLREFMHAEH